MNFKGFKWAVAAGIGGCGLCLSSLLLAAEDEMMEEVVAVGIRGSLQSAVDQKRDTDNLTEVIVAQDIGKLPDQNLAEVLENITGVQITRSAGVGTAVQIRGTDENRTQINGVSTVGSGSGRGGISFEDVSASIISAVEVIKAPEAKTIEGSVGGTINLRTLRPLELTDSLIAVRVQGENSDLSTDSTFLPRLSGTVGNNWFSEEMGEFGVVFSGSYTRQDVTAFRPRVDRDGVVLTTNTGLESREDFDFLRIQFFNQDYDNFEYETLNYVASFEWKPNENLRFFFDTIYNDQERRQESTRVQLSGVSDSDVVSTTDNTSFETVNLGSLDGERGSTRLGTVQAATSGFLFPDPDPFSSSGLNPNLRGSSDTGARVTESQIFRFGGEWEHERLSVFAEMALSDSDSVFPNFSTTIDFINPNSAQPLLGESLDNGVPLEYDLRGGMLTFGLLQGHETTPTSAQLLDPANYQLRQVQQGRNRDDNSEDAFRIDFSYDFTDMVPVLTSVDVGWRRHMARAVNDNLRQNFNYTSASNSFNRPNGDLFADVLVAGPDNFNEADDRRLYVRDYLIIDPEAAFDNPGRVREVLNRAITTNNAATEGVDVPLITVPTQALTEFFDIEEETNAVYVQANFAAGVVRGNVGFRWLDTTLESIGQTVIDGQTQQIRSTGGYDFLLPRLNLVAEVQEDVLLRAAYTRDINRPDFNDLSTSVSFPTSPNDAVQAGNPNLMPEEVESYDFTAEWYFAPASVVSIGYFHKTRTDLFVTQTENPADNADPLTGQLNVDITDPCEQGGIFNPIADRNVLNPATGEGICVPYRSTFNGAGSTKQKGVEIAFQSDLSRFEDRFEGFEWISGFGLIANYTRQDFDGGDEFVTVTGGRRNVFTNLGLTDLTSRATLLNLSENAWNITLFYEKYGITARMRYTWRDAFRSDDDDFFDLFVVEEARAQVNANLSYLVNDNLTVSLQAINLLQEDAEQSCINEGALLCFQDLTDRRVVVGAAYRF